jgi:hypothetical protein
LRLADKARPERVEAPSYRGHVFVWGTAQQFRGVSRE